MDFQKKRSKKPHFQQKISKIQHFHTAIFKKLYSFYTAFHSTKFQFSDTATATAQH